MLLVGRSGSGESPHMLLVGDQAAADQAAADQAAAKNQAETCANKISALIINLRTTHPI